MRQKIHYRHELKYTIPYAEYIAMRGRLRHVMTPDPHAAADGTYLVRSIYFDNGDNRALREKIDGVGPREKFRVRYYNDDLSFMVLEKKIKHGNLCMKYSAPITQEACRELLAGRLDWMRASPHPLVLELYAKMRGQGLRPRVMVSYIREPYAYPPGNVRVTFDSQIRTSLFRRDYLDGPAHDISVNDTPQERILEVKYDAFLPDVIRKLIQTPGIRQQAFSKYAACRRFG